MAEAYGWTPEQVGQLTDKQIRMYLASADSVRADDWSAFGLVNDNGILRGSDEAMERYMLHRCKLKEAA